MPFTIIGEIRPAAIVWTCRISPMIVNGMTLEVVTWLPAILARSPTSVCSYSGRIEPPKRAVNVHDWIHADLTCSTLFSARGERKGRSSECLETCDRY